MKRKFKYSTKYNKDDNSNRSKLIKFKKEIDFANKKTIENLTNVAEKIQLELKNTDCPSTSKKIMSYSKQIIKTMSNLLKLDYSQLKKELDNIVNTKSNRSDYRDKYYLTVANTLLKNFISLYIVFEKNKASISVSKMNFQYTATLLSLIDYNIQSINNVINNTCVIKHEIDLTSYNNYSFKDEMLKNIEETQQEMETNHFSCSG